MSEEKDSKVVFEQLYLKERKKAQIFMTVSIILAVVLVGSFVVGAGKNLNLHGSQSGSPTPVSTTDTQGSDELVGNIKDYFKADGSVDEAKVQALKDRVPSQFASHLGPRIEPQIDTALKNGDITSKQAIELKKAFGI